MSTIAHRITASRPVLNSLEPHIKRNARDDGYASGVKIAGLELLL